MLVGSFASTFYGATRTTRDIDLVVALEATDSSALRHFVDACERDGLYVAREAALGPTAVRRQFNVISPTGWKVDFMERDDRPFSRTEFERRQAVDLLGVSVMIASAEDTILAKLEWGANQASRQFDDAVGIVQTMGEALDNAYLDRWAAEIGVTTLLADVRRAAEQQG